MRKSLLIVLFLIATTIYAHVELDITIKEFSNGDIQVEEVYNNEKNSNHHYHHKHHHHNQPYHALPSKIIGGYACNSSNLTSQKIIDAGFNYVLISFFDLQVSGGQFQIVENKCCQPTTLYQIAQELVQAGVTVAASIGGDGCQGSPSQAGDILDLSEEAIVAGFENFIKQTGVQFSGMDFDWEGDSSNVASDAINKIGSALRGAGYTCSAVPMSSQFNPGGLFGWKSLNPSDVDLVMPQWYQGGCTGTQSCPCWGQHPITKMPTCPGFNSQYMGQSAKCGIQDWVEGFKTPGVGGINWDEDQVVIGVKSWCGGNDPQPCGEQDTGIWGTQDMINILEATNARGIVIWDLNDYFNVDYYNVGNPINDECKWTNSIKQYFELEEGEMLIIKQNTVCANYNGPMPYACTNSQE